MILPCLNIPLIIWDLTPGAIFFVCFVISTAKSGDYTKVNKTLCTEVGRAIMSEREKEREREREREREKDLASATMATIWKTTRPC